MDRHVDHFSRGLLLLLLAAMLLLSLTGCVTNPAKGDGNKAADAGPLFYPPLPAGPRIQYLTTIASERDLIAKQDSFADFVLGDEKDLQRLSQPYGMALYQGKLLVADTGAGGVATFDLTQQKFELFTGSGAGRMKRPINIRIDSDGTRYVTDTGRNQILVYDSAQRFITAFGSEGQFRPVDLAIAKDRLYVVDILHHQVQVLDKKSGKTLFTFGKAGSEVGELYHPTNIALGPDGDVYVVETSNYRVQRFTAEGKSVRMYGEVGSTLGTFARPKGIAVDKSGRILVGDAAFQNVQVFDNDGKLLLFFGEPGERGELLNLPAGVSIDYDNIAAFQKFADPRFKIDYLIMVASQFGPNKVDIFGFGKLRGGDYSADQRTVTRPAT